MSKPSFIRSASQEQYTNCLWYGFPGCGKSSLAATTAKQWKTLIIRPPTDHFPRRVLNYPNLETAVMHDWAEMTDMQIYLRMDGADEYEWVWLDSISAWQDIGLDDIWAATIERKPMRAQYGLDRGEYGINMQRLEQWVRHVVGVQAFNFGITAHTFEAFDPADEEGGIILKPWVQGKGMSDKICGYMQMVGYLEVKKEAGKDEYRVLNVKRNGDYYAKDQNDAPIFGARGRLRDPDMVTIVESIQDSAPRPRVRRRRAATAV